MSQASVSIRFNPFKVDAAIIDEIVAGNSEAFNFQGRRVPWNPYALILEQRPLFTLDPLFHAGCYYVQDSSAMFVGHIFRKLLPLYQGKRPRVLDLCAAPGGKSTDIAASLRESFASSFELTSNEVIKTRASILKDNICTWGDPNVIVTSADPSAFDESFDIIVADVPCSGEGMFRKDPRAQEEWSPELVELCAARQKRILADIWPSLKSGGLLIYSTCTYEKAENDDNLLWAASELGGEIIRAQNEFEEYGVELTQCGYLLRAGIVPGEGQWVGALVKSPEESQRKSRSGAGVRPIWQGYNEVTVKGKDLIPDLNSPLSIEFDSSLYPNVDLDLQTALNYLHRDSLVLKDAAIGYNTVSYRGHRLGFVKNIGPRCNNLLPKSRRILMSV